MSNVNYLNSSPRMEQLGLIKATPSTTLANFVGSVLSHSLNRVYLVRATPSPKFLASLGTSDILETLSEMFGCLIYTYTCHALKVKEGINNVPR